jgi:alpha-N-arabinofuranosidase
MKKLFTTLTLAIALPQHCNGRRCHSTIHANQGKQIIYKEIYGQFAEHLGSCIYGGLWVGENSIFLISTVTVKMFSTH